MRIDLAWERSGPTASIEDAKGRFVVVDGSADAILRAQLQEQLDRVFLSLGGGPDDGTVVDGEAVAERLGPDRAEVLVRRLEAAGWYRVTPAS